MTSNPIKALDTMLAHGPGRVKYIYSNAKQFSWIPKTGAEAEEGSRGDTLTSLDDASKARVTLESGRQGTLIYCAINNVLLVKLDDDKILVPDLEAHVGVVTEIAQIYSVEEGRSPLVAAREARHFVATNAHRGYRLLFTEEQQDKGSITMTFMVRLRDEWQDEMLSSYNYDSAMHLFSEFDAEAAGLEESEPPLSERGIDPYVEGTPVTFDLRLVF